VTVLDEPAPRVDDAAAAAIVTEHYGLRVDAAVSLPAERDRNFLIHVAGGQTFVLKVANSAEDPRVLDMECAAMRHVADVDPGLPVPRIHGETVPVSAVDGRTHLVRLISGMPGTPADRERQPAAFAAQLGAACARMSRALRGFTHPAAARDLDWDPRDVARLGPAPDPGLETSRFAGLRVATRALPAGVQHGDLNLGNVLVDDNGSISGLIDFGDMHHTARVADLAIGLAAVMRQAADPWAAAAGLLDGYQRLAPLEPEEVDVLGELVLARTVAGLLISARMVARHPANGTYLAQSDDVNRRLLDLLGPLEPTALADRFHRMCGTGRSRPSPKNHADLAARRRGALGDDNLAPMFYKQPIQVTRAAGPWVHAADGRRYLDAYNNVPVLGHTHPAVVQAISRQSAVLNLNSRYLHPHAVELAERLLATMPAGLDTCVFANSGSEVNDLAWRMAVLYTGNTGAIAADLAYHGVSAATSALSTNTHPPGARPAHVAVFTPPGPGPDEADARAAVEAARAELRRGGHDVALTVVDSVFSAAGIREPDPGYMRGLVAATHAGNGLFLADEVQAGFGRGGGNLWRFQDFGIEPDFVTLGKPMGNGHPVAALITRRDVAEGFAAVDEYFSTFGGNPVSCVAALTVLDIVEQNSLVANAGRIGAALRAGLRELASGRPGIVDVRGPGLMIGVELDPAWLTARELAERLRGAGVLVGTTGPGGATLKVRPPLIWTDEQVETFLTAFRSAVS
jgi:4-aminobutyrate aminotransferase-like enzyme/Ser/Thr protein kinase RdoA (MazF antagonist)